MTWLIGAAAAIVLLSAAGSWMVFSKKGASATVSASGPDSALIESRVEGQLPPFVKMSNFTLEPSTGSGSAQAQTFSTPFKGQLQLNADTFVASSTIDDVVIATPRAAQGSTRDVSGVVTSRKVGDGWDTVVAFDGASLADLGTPRDGFAGKRLIVAGSPEEAAFQQEREGTPAQVAATTPTPSPVAPTLAPVPATAAPPQAASTLAGRTESPAPSRPATTSTPASVPAPAQTPSASPSATVARPAPAAIPAPVPSGPPSTPATQTAATAATTAAPLAPPSPRPQPDPPGAGTSAPPERPAATTAASTTFVEVPAGTEMEVRLLKRLNSGKVSVEDRFEATTVNAFTVGSRTVVPAGSVMRGSVVNVQPATRTNRTAHMTLGFDQITVNGHIYAMKGTLREVKGSGLKGEAAKIGAAAAVGAVLGGILGGGKGAVAGLGVGGGGVLAATEGKEIDMPEGTVLRVKVDAPLQIQQDSVR